MGGDNDVTGCRVEGGGGIVGVLGAEPLFLGTAREVDYNLGICSNYVDYIVTNTSNNNI